MIAASLVVFLPGGMSRWFLPKLAIALIACAIALWARPSGRVGRPVVVLMGAGAIVAVLAACLGSTPPAQLLGRWPRYEGLLALAIYVAVLFSGARLLGPRANYSNYRALWGGWSVASILITAVSVLEELGLRPIESDLDRPGSLLGNASDQGLICVALASMLLPVVLRRQTQRDEMDWWYLVGLVTAASGVVLSASRAALLAFGVVILVFVVLEAIRWMRAQKGSRTRAAARRSIIELSVFAAGIAAVVALAPGMQARLTTDQIDVTTVGDRLSIWKVAASVLTSHPFVGVGPNGFADAAPAQFSSEWYLAVAPYLVLDSPHSAVLQIVLAGGLLGALWLLAAAVVSGREVRFAVVSRPDDETSRTFTAGAALALIGLGVGFVVTFTASATMIVAAFLIGALIARAPEVRLRGATARSSRGIQALACVASALVVLAALGELPLRAATDALSRGDIEAATAQFQAASALRPWDADVTSIAAQAFAGASDSGLKAAVQPCLEWSASAIARLPQSIPPLMAQAVCQQAEGDYKSALATIARVHAISPLDPTAYTRSGIIHALGGDLDSAEADLRRSVAISPLDAVAWNALAIVYRASGQRDESAKAQKQAESLAPAH